MGENESFRDLLRQVVMAISTLEQFTGETTKPCDPENRLEILLDGLQYYYDGSETLVIDFGNLITRISALETAISDGRQIIADAISDIGSATSSEDTPQEMAANMAEAGQYQYAQGVAAGTLQGQEQGHADVVANPRAYGLWSDADYQAMLNRSWTKRFRLSVSAEDDRSGWTQANLSGSVELTFTAQNGNISVGRSGTYTARAARAEDMQWRSYAYATATPDITQA
jgi:hypothetical protein